MAKRNKGHDKQKALIKLRLKFMGVENMDHATLAQLKTAARKITKPYESFMDWVIGTKRLQQWNAFLKARKQGSKRDKAVLNDKPIRHDLHPNERESIEILEGSYG